MTWYGTRWCNRYGEGVPLPGLHIPRAATFTRRRHLGDSVVGVSSSFGATLRCVALHTTAQRAHLPATPLAFLTGAPVTHYTWTAPYLPARLAVTVSHAPAATFALITRVWTDIYRLHVLLQRPLPHGSTLFPAGRDLPNDPLTCDLLTQFVAQLRTGCAAYAALLPL